MTVHMAKWREQIGPLGVWAPPGMICGGAAGGCRSGSGASRPTHGRAAVASSDDRSSADVRD